MYRLTPQAKQGWHKSGWVRSDFVVDWDFVLRDVQNRNWLTFQMDFSLVIIQKPENFPSWDGPEMVNFGISRVKFLFRIPSTGWNPSDWWTFPKVRKLKVCCVSIPEAGHLVPTVQVGCAETRGKDEATWSQGFHFFCFQMGIFLQNLGVLEGIPTKWWNFNYEFSESIILSYSRPLTDLDIDLHAQMVLFTWFGMHKKYSCWIIIPLCKCLRFMGNHASELSVGVFLKRNDWISSCSPPTKRHCHLRLIFAIFL